MSASSFESDILHLLLSLSHEECHKDPITEFIGSINTIQDAVYLRLLSGPDTAADEVIDVSVDGRCYARVGADVKCPSTADSVLESIKASARLLAILLERRETPGMECVYPKPSHDPLSDHHAHMSSIYNAISCGVVVQDADGKIIFANPAAAQILDMEVEGINGRTSYDPRFAFIREDLTPFTVEGYPSMVALATGEAIHNVVMGLINKCGQYIWFLADSEPILDGSSGTITSVVSTFMNITARKRIESALTESESRLSDLFNSAKDIIVILNAEGDILGINQAAEELTGYTHDELMRSNALRDIVIPEDSERLEPLVEKIIRGEDQLFEVRCRAKDGSIIHFEVSASPWMSSDGTFISTRCILRNITDRKLNEDTIAKTRDFYLTLFDEFPSLIWRSGLDGKCDYFNKTWLQFTGKTLEQEMGYGWSSGVHVNDLDHCYDTYINAFNLRQTFEMEYRLLRHDGIYRWIVDIARPFYDIDGSFAGYIGSCYDITDRKQAEEALKDNEEQFRRIVETASEGIWIIDADNKTTFVNCRMAEMLGYAVDEIVGRSLHEFIEDEGHIIPDVNEDYWKDRTHHKQHEFKLINKNGAALWVSVSTTAFLDRNDSYAGVLAMVSDVTEKRLVAERLAREAQVNSAMAELSRAMLSSESIDEMSELILEHAQRMTGSEFGCIGYIDQRTGQRVSPTLSKHIWDSCSVADKKTVFSCTSGLWAWVTENRKPLVCNSVADDLRSIGTPPGHIPIQQFVCVPAMIGDNVAGHLALANPGRFYNDSDIVLIEQLASLYALAIQRTRADETLNLLASQQAIVAFLGQCGLAGTDLPTLFDNATTLIARNLEVGQVAILELQEEHNTISLRSSVGLSDEDFEPGLYSPQYISHAAYALEVDEPVIIESLESESRFEAPLLTELGIISGCIVVIHGPVRPFGILSVYTRVQRSFTQDEIHFLQTVSNLLAMMIEGVNADAHLRVQASAIDATSDLIVITNADAEIELVNPAFEKETGYSASEVFGENPRMLKSGKQSDEFYEELWRTLLSGNTWHGEVINKRKDGSLYTEDMTVTPIKTADGVIEHFVAIKRNITEKKIQQEEINRSRKMEIVGKLASGIAHDFNNLLQGILGYTRVLMDYHHLDESSISDLKEIELASQRAADLVRQVLAFSRQLPGQTEPVDVAKLAQEAVRLLQNTLPRTIKVNCAIPDSCAAVLADASQIHQVIMNLCLNARDAMPNGGCLNISVDNITLDDAFVNSNPWARKGEFIRCIVSDTGVGMDADIKDRALEPFFTTKSLQDGVGLGLSTCYGVIMGHDGFLNIESEMGKGTSMSFYLPAANGVVAQDSCEEQVGIVGGSETILLVDDEDYIQRLTERVLRGVGYDVLIAGNGLQAIEHIKVSGKDIRLVILDMNMPEMDGIQALNVIRRLAPSIKIMISTGLDEKLPEDERPDELLRKPYSPEVLLRAIRRTLDSTQ